MNYTLEEAQRISTECLQQCSAIQNMPITKLQQDIRIAELLTEMEGLGVPVMMSHAQEWIKLSDGNALLLQTYQSIGNVRDL